MAKQSLKDKTVKGTIWSGIDNVVQFGVTFVVRISGCIFCGRDAVLPRICKELKDSIWQKHSIDLQESIH